MTRIPTEFLSCFVLCGKMKMFFGETGEMPVRARRRKARKESDLPARRRAGTRHWRKLRRRSDICRAGISDKQSLSHRKIRCDSRRREGIYIKGEYENETDEN